MAIQTFRAIKALKRPQAEWDTENSVIPDQIGAYSIDTGNLKIGDGVRTYAELEFYTYEPPVSTHTHTINDISNFYETGQTFVPVLAGGQHTYLVQEGTYTRIGKMVSVRIRLHLSERDPDLQAGPLQIGGLPYPISSNGPCIAQVSRIQEMMELDIGLVVVSPVEGTDRIQLYLQLTDPMSRLELGTDALTDQTMLDVTCIYERSEST